MAISSRPQLQLQVQVDATQTTPVAKLTVPFSSNGKADFAAYGGTVPVSAGLTGSFEHPHGPCSIDGGDNDAGTIGIQRIYQACAGFHPGI